MRGTPSRTRCEGRQSGIIPAYAGNTVPLRSIHSAYWDHPRICGEHLRGLHACMSEQGSSPHMRGTLLAHGVECAITGIIPAYAGNTFIPRSINIFSQDHPRICGEHIAKNLTTGEVKGSSPHMRGTRIRPPEYARTLGIIPAYAGNTWTPSISPALPWDHPRICGEHSRGLRRMTVARGSSPHMRGTLHKRDYRFPRWRIIPAYAGNTSALSPSGNRYRDHPRICGEHCRNVVALSTSMGSSPHMRGTLSGFHRPFPVGGIIPAYAGNTNRRA